MILKFTLAFLEDECFCEQLAYIIILIKLQYTFNTSLQEGTDTRAFIPGILELTKKELWAKESEEDKLNLFGVPMMVYLEASKKERDKNKILRNEQKGRLDTKSGYVI